ncbi:MAG: DMT family transporter [Planctomycetota bacterium]|nr:DMT family transporter [Planctomycetota bacterium]
MTWLLVLLALAMGIASAVQGATNGTLSGRIGLSSAVLVNASIVFAIALAAWLFTRRSLASEPESPWWFYVGGAYGLFIIAGAAFAFPRLGAGPTTALMVAAQLTTALALDHFGLPSGKVEVTPMRLVGAALLFVGAVLVLWPRLRPEG